MTSALRHQRIARRRHWRVRLARQRQLHAEVAGLVVAALTAGLAAFAWALVIWCLA